jgi:hypothetical protein
MGRKVKDMRHRADNLGYGDVVQDLGFRVQGMGYRI